MPDHTPGYIAHGISPMPSSSPILALHHSCTVPTETSPSLTAVLTRLGHAGAGVCSATTSDLDPVWAAWRRTSSGSALVVLDVVEGGNVLTVRRLLHDVNACTSSDRIRVVGRRVGDRGRALSALSASSASRASSVRPPRSLVLA